MIYHLRLRDEDTNHIPSNIVRIMYEYGALRKPTPVYTKVSDLPFNSSQGSCCLNPCSPTTGSGRIDERHWEVLAYTSCLRNQGGNSLSVCVLRLPNGREALMRIPEYLRLSMTNGARLFHDLKASFVSPYTPVVRRQDDAHGRMNTETAESFLISTDVYVVHLCEVR